MSRDSGNRQQAQKLLQTIGEIDDRFILEAMTAEEKGAAPAAPRRSRFRKYSTWALTAAACLTVVVVGRYVSVNSVKNSGEQHAAVEQLRETELRTAEDSMDSAAEAPVQSVNIADGAEEAAVQDDAGAVGEAMDSAAEVPVQSMNAAGVAEEAAAADAEEYADAAGEAADTAPVTGGKAAGMTGAGAALTMPNPFVNTATLQEAEKEAGFTISLPGAEAPYDTLIYRAIKDELIEVICLDGENNEGCRLRKGKDAGEDISGDYNEYAVEKVLTSEPLAGNEASGQSITATVRGDREDEWKSAIWTREAEDGTVYSYAVCAGARTFTSDEILALLVKLV